MKAVVQRVKRTTLDVDGQRISEIPFGLTVFLGIKCEDTKAQAEYLARKIANLRIFGVRLLFGRGRQWNWHDVIADLGFLASAFRLHTKPSLLAEAKAVHGEAELSLLDSICDSYLSAFPAIASNDGCDTSSMAHGDAIKSQHEDLPDTNTKTSKAVPKTTGASPKDETPTSVGTEG